MKQDVSKPSPVHLINHTHWDREWFLTAEYTTEWIPELIAEIQRLAGRNPRYQYLLDGQTLIVEDLLAYDPDAEPIVKDLVASGNLNIGPLYSQPDWRLSSGELLARNLAYGLSDVERHGGTSDVAWLVDTFGHISQAPQLLAMYGIEGAYIWRGAPKLVPVFRWRGPDGTDLTTINLFGGYRNLYGVSRTPDLAVRRLQAETDKLEPFYGEIPIPLFDGYDLETEPEDPFSFYGSSGDPDRIELVESSPRRYLDAVGGFVATAPIVDGELLSGKFGATFPGTLSTRSYLKVMHHDCELLLHRLVEPVATMAFVASGTGYREATYESWGRELLQNAVHDCICGVSIDQVHERMERSYRTLTAAMIKDADRSLNEIAAVFAPGRYAVSTNSEPAVGTIRTNDEVIRYETLGVGVWPITNSSEVERLDQEVSGYSWSNEHYSAELLEDGTIHVDDAAIGRIVIYADHGDAYSSEPGERLATAQPTGSLTVESRSDTDVIVRYGVAAEWADGSMTANVRVRLSHSSLVEFDIELDSTGSDHRIEMEFDTGLRPDNVWAGMPFDIVERPFVDTNLLDAKPPEELASILMGQREIRGVRDYPFHDFVALTTGSITTAVFAQGLRSYQASPTGQVSITLRRSTEWIALSGLPHRAGDAGPRMYVPDGRCERVVRHRLAFSRYGGRLELAKLTADSQAFQNPPTIVTTDPAATGERTSLTVFAEPAPMSALTVAAGQAVARVYNPTFSQIELGDTYQQVTTARDTNRTEISALAGKEIVSVAVGGPDRQGAAQHTNRPSPRPASEVSGDARIGGPTVDRVGPNRSRPDSLVLDELAAHQAAALDAAGAAEQRLEQATGDAAHRFQHEVYVHQREASELGLSLELNRRKQHCPPDSVSIPDTPDPAIRSLARQLNELRIRRRIYDYVIEVLAPASPEHQPETDQ